MTEFYKFTVLICTYNQCQLLAKVLKYLSKQIVSYPERVELIVVDNNSNDETRQVCETRAEHSHFH